MSKIKKDALEDAVEVEDDVVFSDKWLEENSLEVLKGDPPPFEQFFAEGADIEELDAADSLGDFAADFSFDDFSEAEAESSASQKIQAALSTLNIKDTEGVVTAEDFEEGSPRQAFQIIMHYATALLPELAYPTKRPKNIVYSHEKVMQAIRFIFGREEHEGEGREGINFALCCETIGEYVRPDVIRLRFHYEFWLRQLRFQHEFPFLIDPVPAFIENHAYFLNGKSAAIICDLLWSHPGLNVHELYRRAIDMEPTITLKEWEKSLVMLDEEYIVSDFVGHWYLTGKNPVRSHQDDVAAGRRYLSKYGRLNWSAHFGTPAR